MKKIGNIILNILVVFVVVLSLSMSVMVISSKATGVPNIFGYSPVTVQTDSMVPEFNPGDLLIVKKCEDNTKLNVGDIITYKFVLNDRQALNTHRIIEVIHAGELIKYKTKGDNEDQEDINAVISLDVVGEYTGTKLAGMGKAIDFLKTQNGIFLFFVLPLALLFIWQLYKFIMLLAENKKDKAIEAVTSSLEEEKEKAIEEYKAQQIAQEEAAKAAEAAAVLSVDDIEREKQKAIEEYKAQQKAQEEAAKEAETAAALLASEIEREKQKAVEEYKAQQKAEEEAKTVAGDAVNVGNAPHVLPEDGEEPADLGNDPRVLPENGTEPTDLGNDPGVLPKD